MKVNFKILTVDSTHGLVTVVYYTDQIPESEGFMRVVEIDIIDGKCASSDAIVAKIESSVPIQWLQRRNDLRTGVDFSAVDGLIDKEHKITETTTPTIEALLERARKA